VSGGYETIAAPVFGRIHAARLLLEYDDERSGGFDPLRLVPDDKVVILGLVTTKVPRLEMAGELDDRLRQAMNIIGQERLGIGTQCGFSTSLVGNALSIEDERRKLSLVIDTARRAFGDIA
jgi:5-methyltetrahydropteroyltriglutamate--homocysteine methyltransferase